MTFLNCAIARIAIMLAVIPFFVCITGTIAYPTDVAGSCVISTDYAIGDLREPQPLVLTGDNKNVTVLYPEDKRGTLKISAGRAIYLGCPGKENYLKPKNWDKGAKVVCVGDKIFNVNNEGLYQFSSLFCNHYPDHFPRDMNMPRCLGKHRPIEIGFNVSGTFMRTIELCRNDNTYTTYYTKFKMTKMIGNAQRGFRRPLFKAGNFYPGINIDELYKFKNQMYTIARILDSPDLARKRLIESVQFLSRGHMTAKADFVYGSLQRSTFWYLNVAPQWQSFNEGNWNLLEMSVRFFASNRQLDLDVYTGVHGQMTMEDIHGKQQPVYLDVDREILSAPKFYWKVIYDPLSKRGTAFVGLNDPFIKSVTNDVYICKDISQKIEWLKWNPRNITAGISYACTVNDLRKTVSTVPAFDVIDILI